MPHEPPRRLQRAMHIYRIGDPDGRFPVFSAEGARRTGGRWHEAGQAVIYTSEHYSTALLEILVRLGEMPPNQHYVEVTIPAGTACEELDEAHVPGWDADNYAASRAFGSRWFEEARSAILIVPSVIARLDRNVLIHTLHPDFAGIEARRERPIWWDSRQFGR